MWFGNSSNYLMIKMSIIYLRIQIGEWCNENTEDRFIMNSLIKIIYLLKSEHFKFVKVYSL